MNRVSNDVWKNECSTHHNRKAPQMRYLITGGCGFLGSNLAASVLGRKDELYIIDNMSRVGASDNLQWLRGVGAFKFQLLDVRDREGVENLIADIRPDVVFHLAGQVAMTTSLNDPALDFGTNAVGTFNVLDALRRLAPEAILIYSSTNKVYGDLEWVHYSETEMRYETPDYPHGFDEKTPLDFRSPYGCSKGAADQYVLDFSRCYGIRAVVLRHSSIYGGRQFSTFDQGWIGWFVRKAVEARMVGCAVPLDIAGNGKQVRDVLFSDDLVTCYYKVVQHIDSISGQVFNIGGGVKNSLSLRDLFRILEELLGIRLKFKCGTARFSDQKVFVADIRKARRVLDWCPQVAKHQGIERMITWVESNLESRS